MKTTYESFEELADGMKDGEGCLYMLNCPGDKGCVAWQRGITDFAEWLDHIGLKVRTTDTAKNFYDFMSKKAKKQPSID